MKKAWLYPAAGLVCWTFAGQALALQKPVTVEEALQICAGVKNERDRLDCFEGLAAAANPNQDPVAANDSNDPPTTEQAEVERSAEEQPDSDPNPILPPIADSKEGEKKSQQFVILPAEEAEERLEQPKSPGQKRKAYTSTIRKSWLNGERKLLTLFDTGEVYKQLDSKQVTLPSAGTEIELRPGLVGGWFVEVKKNYPAIKMSLINK